MTEKESRRSFLKKSSTAVGASLAAAQLPLQAYAEGSDLLKIGLIGCGSRGTGAASQALKADPSVKLTAMADAFEDRLEKSLDELNKIDAIKAKIDVPLKQRFVGFDAYKQVLDSDVDVVLLVTPPHFRPMHLKAAVEAGKHIFAEKPVAVDAAGVRSVIETCKAAKAKKLSVVSGLCLRYSIAFQETIKRIHDGAIGKIHTMQANDYRGPIWIKPREPNWTDMHWQMRNWYYFTWLSGDFNVEQHVHFLDVCSWAKGNEYPVKAIGMGGRQVRTGEEYGNIFDHHSVIYEYEDGAKMFSNTRQMKGCKSNLSAQVVGSEGRAHISERKHGMQIDNADGKWVHELKGQDDFYQTEHDELFAGIRKQQPINNGEYMSKSTLLAIMGRMATYTGQEITWEQAMNSKEVLAPGKYEWGDAPEVVIAKPGITRFV